MNKIIQFIISGILTFMFYYYYAKKLSDEIPLFSSFFLLPYISILSSLVNLLIKTAPLILCSRFWVKYTFSMFSGLAKKTLAIPPGERKLTVYILS